MLRVSVLLYSIFFFFIPAYKLAQRLYDMIKTEISGINLYLWRKVFSQQRVIIYFIYLQQ